MDNNHNRKDGRIDVLRGMLAEHQKLLEAAVREMERERPIVISLRDALAALTGEPLSHILQHGEASVSHVVPSGTVTTTTGRVVQEIPGRKSEYAKMTIIDALRVGLQKQKEKFAHVDVLMNEVYLPIRDNDQFYRVKRTVVSELIRGMSKGIFVRNPNAKNSFGLAPQPEKRPTL
jgi:hypothetical protein